MFLMFDFWTWVAVWAVINLPMATWAYMDAKDHDDKSPGDWILIIIGFGFLGLALYFLKRPTTASAKRC
jgi:hypothetical protein